MKAYIKTFWVGVLKYSQPVSYGSFYQNIAITEIVLSQYHLEVHQTCGLGAENDYAKLHQNKASVNLAPSILDESRDTCEG